MYEKNTQRKCEEKQLNPIKLAYKYTKTNLFIFLNDNPLAIVVTSKQNCKHNNHAYITGIISTWVVCIVYLLVYIEFEYSVDNSSFERINRRNAGIAMKVHSNSKNSFPMSHPC